MPSITASPPVLPNPQLFTTLLAACRASAGDTCIDPAAAEIARLTGAGLVSACGRSADAVSEADPHVVPPTRDICPMRMGRELKLPAGPLADVIPRTARGVGADMVAVAIPHGGGSGHAAQLARTLLDSGIAVLALPPPADRQLRLRRIGIGHDGGQPAAAALEVARWMVEAGRGQATRLDVLYVDDSASASYERDSDVLASRREAMIDWWMAGLVQRVLAPVRPLRRVGDPAEELADFSRELDLLVIGTRGRAPLRRAVTGSVSRRLIATVRCPLLIVPPGNAAATAAM
jgi:nucleotide-binding universal stress UspA family protein